MNDTRKVRHEYCMKLCTEEMTIKFKHMFPEELREKNKEELAKMINTCYQQRMYP